MRALKSESSAVRLAVSGHFPPPIREALRSGLAIESTSSTVGHPPDPEAIGWALTLWSERLVGDVLGLDSDPPVVVALTKLGSRDLLRLVKACGLAKIAFAIDVPGTNGLDHSMARFTTIDRVRLAYFRRQIGVADPRLVPLARVDLESIGGDRRRGLAQVGLLTLGRLIAPVEPHRARWAMQHIPYPIARRMRAGESPSLSRKSLLAWESWVLESAWTRLLGEGRMTSARGTTAGTMAGAVS